MFGNLNGPTLVVILLIVLLLFGAPKLPALARSLGQSMKILKKEVRTDGDEPGADTAGSRDEDRSAQDSNPVPGVQPASTESALEDELAQAKAEAEAAKAEAEALRAAAEERRKQEGA